MRTTGCFSCDGENPKVDALMVAPHCYATTRSSAPSGLALSLLACALIAGCSLIGGCAAPGDPVARHPVVPAAVSDLSARQLGNTLSLSFMLPARSMDRQALAEHPTLDIYRAEIPSGSVPDAKTVWRLAITVPSEQVDNYLRGNHVEFRDSLAPDQFKGDAGTSLAYKIRTRVGKARESADSNVVTARIYPPPDAPGNVALEVTESAVMVRWTAVATPAGASALIYRVYRGPGQGGQENRPGESTTVKPEAPPELAGTASTTEFRDSHFEFGAAYVYTVRSAAQFGSEFVESADSAPAPITPKQTFPPAAPVNLELAVIPATAQAAAYVELSWEISAETDLAGYSVYRSEDAAAPGERVSTDLLPSPTFRDMSVVPGKRYYYRATAVDRFGNESAKSSAAEADIP